MKAILAILAIAMSGCTIAATVSEGFLARLAAVESGGNDAAVNAREDAHGRYQIRAGYLADANDALGTAYTLTDCHNPAIAAAVVRAYLMRYGTAFERRTGRTATDADLARIHNGGPRGAEKDCTKSYGEMFQ